MFMKFHSRGPFVNLARCNPLILHRIPTSNKDGFYTLEVADGSGSPKQLVVCVSVMYVVNCAIINPLAIPTASGESVQYRVLDAINVGCDFNRISSALMIGYNKTNQLTGPLQDGKTLRFAGKPKPKEGG